MNNKIYKLVCIVFIFTCVLSLPLLASAQQASFVETGIEIIPDSDSLKSNSFSIMSSSTLGGLWRYPSEERYWLQMTNAAAYFRDVLAGAATYITGATNGETWTADAQRPDGLTITWPTITFYSSYQGQSNCFVSPYWTICGSTSLQVFWWTTIQCQPPGLWTMNFYNNNHYLFSTQFTLLPQIYPGKVPLYNQGSYNDLNNPLHLYDSICRTRTEAGRLDRNVDPCTGAPNEVPWTIAGKGCYLAAAAMILSYHGVERVDLPTLNTWLKDNEGYNRRGLVIRERIAEYARQQEVNMIYDPQEPDPQRVWAGLDNKFERYICYYGPHIIKVPNRNHWVTGTGKNFQRTTYLVNDPEGGVARTLTGFNAMRVFGGPEYTYTDITGITIDFHSPGELLLTDPQGRKVGYDPITMVAYNEIPRAYYETSGLEDAETGDPGPESKILWIPRPLAGDYQLQVIGTDTGVYTLEIRATDPEGNQSLKIFIDISITPGKIHTYGFYYAKTVGAELEFKAVTGNFDGKGQRPSDVNKFLSYVVPIQSATELPVGTTNFSLVIIYDKNIIPATFTATLNGVDVKSLFHPAPGSAESVPLNLNQGRNTLILSVKGNLPNRVARDTDRLVFIVP